MGKNYKFELKSYQSPFNLQGVRMSIQNFSTDLPKHLAEKKSFPNSSLKWMTILPATDVEKKKIKNTFTKISAPTTRHQHFKITQLTSKLKSMTDECINLRLSNSLIRRGILTKTILISSAFVIIRCNIYGHCHSMFLSEKGWLF